MANKRTTSRKNPPPDIHGLPTKQYPTSNVFDIVIVEDIDIRLQRFGPPLIGTPHPKESAAKLVWIGPVHGNDSDKMQRRIYANVRNGQDAYNAARKYVAEAAGYPVYIRSYLELAPPTAPVFAQPLTGLVDLTLTAGGAGYTTAPTITFTGGGGTGATAVCHIVDGIVVAILLTNGGTGYTSVPTVLFSSGAAAATAVIQSPNKTIGSITITNGGTAYVTAPTITITGGGGTGATAVATLTAGIVTAITITNPGTGYTSVPTVTFSSGAAAGTAVLETHTAVLVHQESAPAEGEVGGLFDQVTRVYKTLPGPWIITRQWASGGLQLERRERDVLSTQTLVGGSNVMSERIEGVNDVESKQIIETLLSATGAPLGVNSGEYTLQERDGEAEVTVYTTYRIVAASYSLPHERETISITVPAARSGWVIEGKLHQIEGSPNCLAEIVWSDAPLTRTDFIDYHYTFPGIFSTLRPWWDIPISAGALRRPWIGVDVAYRAPQSLDVTARRTMTFTLGSDTKLPIPYRVVSPGSASKQYPFITGNTIHEAIQVYNYIGTEKVLVEDIAESFPSHYDPQQTLLVESTATKWRGPWYLRKTVEVSESRNPQDFEQLLHSSWFTANNQVDLVRDMIDVSPTGSIPLIAFSSAADARTLLIRGKTTSGGNAKVKETLALSGTAYVSSTTSDWKKVFQATLSAAGLQTVDLRAPGTPNTGSFELKTGLATGNTLALSRTVAPAAAVTRTYTFTHPETTTITCGTRKDTGIKAGGTLTIGTNPLDGDFFTVGTKVYTFKSSVTGGGNVDGYVKIGANLTASALNVVDAINIEPSTAGTAYADLTRPHQFVFAADGGAGQVDVTAIEGGVAGNSIVSTESTATVRMTWTGATLTGGAVGLFGIYDFNSGSPRKVFVYFDKSGADAAPSYTYPDRRLKIDISSTEIVTASDVATALSAALVEDGAWQSEQLTTGVLTVADKFLGTRTNAAIESATLTGAWSIAVAVNGTAQAANQIRIWPTPAEAAAAALATLLSTTGTIAATIAAGQCSTGTTALAFVTDISGSRGGAVVTIADSQTLQPSTIVWSVTTNSSATVDIINVEGGAPGPLVAQFAPGATEAYQDIDLYNPTFEINVPALVQVTTDPIETGGRAGFIVLRATETPAIPVVYQVSADGSTAWGDGVTPGNTVALTSIGGGVEYKFALPVANYIRLKINNGVSTTGRAVAAGVYLNLTN